LDSEELKKRTKEFDLRVIRLTASLPASRVATIIGRKLLRAGTSVGATYRAACRARSKLDFISRTRIAIEEADESLYWMEMLVDADLIPREKLAPVMKEASEVIAILTASVKTARAHLRQKS
jgi:four helix bundle protein